MTHTISNTCITAYVRVEYINVILFLQVNDAVLVGDNTLVSCSSDTTLKVC